jgi:hypothetical protein
MEGPYLSSNRVEQHWTMFPRRVTDAGTRAICGSIAKLEGHDSPLQPHIAYIALNSRDSVLSECVFFPVTVYPDRGSDRTSALQMPLRVSCRWPGVLSGLSMKW